MTQTFTPEVMRQIRWPLRLTWAALWAERLSRAFWLVWSLCLLALSALSLDLLSPLPLEAAWAVLVATVLAALVMFVFGWRQFRAPNRAEAMARLDASLPGQPLSALADDMAIGGQDPAARAVWQAHRSRMAARAAEARMVRPDLKLAPRDPFGLRFLALTALLVALMFGSVWRVVSLGPLGAGPAEAMMTGPTWEGWAQPPLHTGKPALYLNDIAAGPLDLPRGTRVQLRLYGEVGTLTLSETVSAAIAPPPASDLMHSFEVLQDGAIAINGPQGRIWQVIALKDMPPKISLGGDITRDREGKMKLPFAAEDDFAIASGTAQLTLDLAQVDRRFGLTAEPEARAPLVLDLPLPISGNRARFEDALIEDLSDHPWANLPVQIRLEVQDAQGQTGQAETLATTLPGKRFFDPLAAAIIELRRDLLWTRSNAPRSSQIFKAITHHPDDLIRDETTFARLKSAIRRLDAAGSGLQAEARDALAKELWEIALLVEEGDLASARDGLARAQERLNEAIRNGADPAEIQSLMEELRAATDDYMRLLAQEAERNPDGAEADASEQMELTGDQIQEMMDEIQRLMEEGKMAEAAEAMAMLQKLLENLQITEGSGGSGGPQMPGMKGLQETLRDQQGLSDEAFRNLQGDGQPSPGPDGDPPPAPEGQDEGSLADRQQALQDRLDRLNDGPLPGPGTEPGQEGRSSLGEAERRMTEAERALREGDLSGALDRQAEAMDALREGIRALGDAQAEADRQDQGGTQEETRDDTGLDPLGREPVQNGRRIGSDRNLAQGPDVQRRAQELLDEIRRRAGEQDRSQTERDYLRRLLELF